MLKEKEKAINAVLTVADVIFALLTFNLVLFLEFNSFSFIHYKDSIILHLLIVIIWFLLGSGLGSNFIFRSRPYSVVLFNCIGLVAAGTSLLAIAIYSFNLFYLGVKLIFLFSLINLVLSFTFKFIIYKYLKSIRKKGMNQVNLLVIGDNTATSFINKVLEETEWGYRIVAFVGQVGILDDPEKKIARLSDDVNVEQLLRDKTVDEVILIKEYPDQGEVENLVQICSDVGVVFRMYSPFFNMMANKTHLQYFGTLPLLSISNTPSNYIELKVKGLFDVLFSAFVLIILSPVYLLIAVAIKFDSKGPVIFRQKRVGLRGRRFYVYKFRTMVTDAEKLKCELEDKNEMDGPVFKIANDPRITRVGSFLRKTSMDELPQFYNVLKGEMSVVGPRPPLPSEVRQYKRWQLRRLSMKPGITCIWQVSGRNSIKFDEWMKMDMQYIDNWSLKLDFTIFLKTIRTILRSDGK